jgi:methylmalonyl-CoA mutase N-terminal domain/subunit
LVPPIVAAAKEMATMGEIVDAMKTVFGEWTETPVV